MIIQLFPGCQMQKHLAAAGIAAKNIEDLKNEDLIFFANSVKKNVCKNTAKTIFASLAAKLRPLRPDLEFQNIFFVRTEKAVKIALSEKDLEKIENFRAQTELQEFAQTLFLLCAKTGARVADALEFQTINIEGNYLHYISGKTKTNTFVPIGSSTKNLITRIASLKKFSLHSYNSTIREICCLVGIDEQVQVFSAGKRITGSKWQFVSSHTARRSFATNLFLRGCDIYDISKMMGHASVNMTNGYICAGGRKLSDKTMEYLMK